ncbi:unnamed protein product [Protopolystoma xenopodis]|uniref:Uncharacterized protein n=1 Tax=Protopolystoma xenopodis TaxID=117903 RepID=A0A448WF51_9PLAT|nr:unnamed protein product [Protopolystoma xenopodis]
MSSYKPCLLPIGSQDPAQMLNWKTPGLDPLLLNRPPVANVHQRHQKNAYVGEVSPVGLGPGSNLSDQNYRAPLPRVHFPCWQWLSREHADGEVTRELAAPGSQQMTESGVGHSNNWAVIGYGRTTARIQEVSRGLLGPTRGPSKVPALRDTSWRGNDTPGADGIVNCGGGDIVSTVMMAPGTAGRADGRS